MKDSTVYLIVIDILERSLEAIRDAPNATTQIHGLATNGLALARKRLKDAGLEAE